MTLKSDPANNKVLSKSLAPAAQAATDAVLKRFQELVDGHFENNSWKPLTQATIRQRLELKFSAGPPLIRSSTLRENVAKVIHPAQVSGSTVTGSVEPNSGAQTSYSKEQLGNYAAALNKERPFWELSDSDKAELKKTFLEAFLKARTKHP